MIISFMNAGPLSNLDAFYGKTTSFGIQVWWFWQKDILQHLQDIKPAVMTVGGWFDAEDLYGPLNTYQTIENQ
jgi:hypothetical protein